MSSLKEALQEMKELYETFRGKEKELKGMVEKATKSIELDELQKELNPVAEEVVEGVSLSDCEIRYPGYIWLEFHEHSDTVMKEMGRTITVDWDEFQSMLRRKAADLLGVPEGCIEISVTTF